MTFRDPAMLAGLVLLPLAALAYLSMHPPRRRDPAAFATPDLMPNLLTGRPGWRSCSVISSCRRRPIRWSPPGRSARTSPTGPGSTGSSKPTSAPPIEATFVFSWSST